LVIASPPYGPSVHGHFDEQLRRHGIIAKLNNQYGHDPRNLAHADAGALASGFGQILTGCVPLLRPGGIVAVTARPTGTAANWSTSPAWSSRPARPPGSSSPTGAPALIAGIRNGRLVPRPSFFQLRNLRRASRRHATVPPATRGGHPLRPALKVVEFQRTQGFSA
jgi:hypothetical protein